MLTAREQLGTVTARVLTRAIAELSACIAEFHADLEVGELSRLTPARLAYARRLATTIGSLAVKHGQTLPRLADYARNACNDLNNVETAAVRASQ